MKISSYFWIWDASNFTLNFIQITLNIIMIVTNVFQLSFTCKDMSSLTRNYFKYWLKKSLYY